MTLCASDIGKQQVADAFVLVRVAMTGEVLLQVLFQFLFLTACFL
jgi:hypothetical protein